MTVDQDEGWRSEIISKLHKLIILHLGDDVVWYNIVFCIHWLAYTEHSTIASSHHSSSSHDPRFVFSPKISSKHLGSIHSLRHARETPMYKIIRQQSAIKSRSPQWKKKKRKPDPPLLFLYFPNSKQTPQNAIVSPLVNTKAVLWMMSTPELQMRLQAIIAELAHFPP